MSKTNKASANRTPEQTVFIFDAVRRAKAEIVEDLISSRVPAWKIASFGDLHDYVDANEYGGLCDDEVIDRGNELFPERTDDTIKSQGLMDACEEIQNTLDAWIKSGEMLKAYEAEADKPID